MSDKKKGIHILMTGGGTLGPVTPLFAVADAWKKQNDKVIVSWIGTPNGPEDALVEEKGYRFFELASAKLDRHSIIKWIFIPFIFTYSLIRSFFLLKNLKPDIIFSAGGYVSVPVVMVASLLGIPTWVHQLDVKPGLANKIMAPFATKVSTTFEKSAKHFAKKKTVIVGGIERRDLIKGDGNVFLRELEMPTENPTVLVFGGGTGAAAINKAILAILPDITKRANVIHLTGEGKNAHKSHKNYQAIELLTGKMADAYAAADIVVARAGMGTILEIIALKKPTILIPIPDSHQEYNAKALEQFNAAVVIHKLMPQVLKQEIERLIKDGGARRSLEKNLGEVLQMGAEKRIVKEAQALLSLRAEGEAI